MKQNEWSGDTLAPEWNAAEYMPPHYRAALAGIAALGVSTSMLYPTISSGEARDDPEAVIITKYAREHVPGSDVVRVIDPDNPKKNTYGEDKIRKGYNVADQTISRQTGGHYRLTIDAMNVVEQTPENSEMEGEGKACFTHDELKKIEKNYRQRENLGNKAVTLVMENTPFCNIGEHKKMAAFAYHPSPDEYGMIAVQPGMTDFLADESSVIDEKKPKPNMIAPSLLAHEYGHLWGLGHAGELKCTETFHYPNGTTAQQTTLGPLEVPEVNKLSACGPVKVTGTKKTDMYAASESVMGTRSAYDIHEKGAYTLPELVRIDPKNYPVTQTDFSPNEYEISPDLGSSKGIAIALPEEHPLRRADKDVTHLMVGLKDVLPPEKGADRQKSLDIGVYALTNKTGNGIASYTIETQSNTRPPRKKDTARLRERMQRESLSYDDLPTAVRVFREPIVYLDKENNVAIRVVRDVDTDKLLLKVSTAESVKPNLRHLKAEQKRRETVVATPPVLPQ